MKDGDNAPKNKYSNLDRGSLVYAAGFPGICYIFLKKFHYLLWYILGYGAIIFIWTTISNVILKLITPLLLYGLMVIISAIDAEYQCNLLRIPYRDPRWELRIRDYGHAYRKCILIFSILGIGCFVIDMIILGFTPINLIVPIMWSLMAILGYILVYKYRNVTYLDMPICETRNIEDPEVVAYYDGFKKEWGKIKAIPKKDKIIGIIALSMMGVIIIIVLLIAIILLAR